VPASDWEDAEPVETTLLVDDEPDVRAVARDVLAAK
jgi:hypothetical protein